MIVDTSALVAVTYREPEYEAIREALLAEPGWIPAPVLVEFHRVTSLADNMPNHEAAAVIATALASMIEIAPFDSVIAEAAVAANSSYGSGNGRGGKLNMLDLMVYGAAKTTGRPILCTGKDFASTDAAIHPASRST